MHKLELDALVCKPEASTFDNYGKSCNDLFKSIYIRPTTDRAPAPAHNAYKEWNEKRYYSAVDAGTHVSVKSVSSFIDLFIEQSSLQSEAVSQVYTSQLYGQKLLNLSVKHAYYCSERRFLFDQRSKNAFETGRNQNVYPFYVHENVMQVDTFYGCIVLSPYSKIIFRRFCL